MLMTTGKDRTDQTYKVRILQDSVKFYLPRVEGYLEIVRNMASKYGAMSLIEFDDYFHRLQQDRLRFQHQAPTPLRPLLVPALRLENSTELEETQGHPGLS